MKIQKSTWWYDKILTLKWPRYFYSRWCPRGVPWNPPKKTTFPPEFCNQICTIYVRTIKNSNSAKKKKLNVVPFQNGGQITDFYFASFRFWPNFEKPLSERNFSMIFGSKKENIDLHYWNKTFEKLFRFKMVAKTIFWYCAIMLIYAN